MEPARILTLTAIPLIVAAAAIALSASVSAPIVTASRSIEATVATPDPSAQGGDAPSATTPATLTPSASVAPAVAPRPIEGARVVVPRLDIDLPLQWGDITRDVPRSGYEGATPERVALVFPGSALPASGGNTYVYAHARAGMFLRLWEALPGDLIVLRWPSDELRYTVRQVVPRVSVLDASWLDPSGPERLTLQTSTGPRAADPRFVVVAIPVQPR